MPETVRQAIPMSNSAQKYVNNLWQYLKAKTNFLSVLSPFRLPKTIRQENASPYDKTSHNYS